MSEEKSRLSRLFHRGDDNEQQEKRSFEKTEHVRHDVAEQHPPSQPSSSTQPHPTYQENPDLHQNPHETKAQPPTYAPSRTTFASLSLHSSDKIRLLEFPVEVVEAVRICIQRNYVKGIQSEKNNYGGSHEFKLKGYPWSGQGSDAIPSRMVIREILSTLFTHGWILLTGVDVSRKEADCDTLLFRHEPLLPSSPSRRDLEWLAISFNESDKFRFISSSASSTLPPLITATSGMLRSMSLYSREEWKDQGLGAYQFKCSKYVWALSGEDTMRSRALLLGLLGLLEERGWALYASVDQSVTAGNVSETDTWYLVRERGWVEGMKVWHR